MIIGIDPGSTGGIAIWTGKELVTKQMPSSIPELKKFIQEVQGRTYTGCVKIIIEKQALRGSDLSAIQSKDEEKANIAKGRLFNVVKSFEKYNKILGMLEALGYTYDEVMPTEWQKSTPVKEKVYAKRKAKFKEFAKLKFPYHEVYNYSADALLILRFAMNNLAANPHWYEKRISSV
jgi:hypothetical protein